MTGRVEQGIVRTGDEVEILGIQAAAKTTVTGAWPLSCCSLECDSLRVLAPVKTTVTGIVWRWPLDFGQPRSVYQLAQVVVGAVWSTSGVLQPVLAQSKTASTLPHASCNGP